jgi:hypothetical protein
MNEENNQIPIIKFLKKHQWRIILPVLFMTFFISLPLVLTTRTFVNQVISIKSATLTKNELSNDAALKIQYVQTDEFLKGLVVKYDLFRDENDEETKVENLRQAIKVKLDNENWIESVSVYVDTIFNDKKDTEFINEVTNDVVAQFERNPNWRIDKYVTKPYHSSLEIKISRLVTNIFVAMVLFSVPLILLWESPNMFYSRKTKEMVFEPLLADWQSELTDAKLRNQTWNAVQINIRYYLAFLSAMLQKSPLGDFAEFIGKNAK